MFGTTPRSRQDLALHPTVKPTALVRDAIQDVTRRGDLVLDSFLGSGASLIASERCERRFRGIDLDPAYVDVALERWEATTGRTPDWRTGDIGHEARLVGGYSAFLIPATTRSCMRRRRRTAASASATTCRADGLGTANNPTQSTSRQLREPLSLEFFRQPQAAIASRGQFKCCP
jgi:DNA methylase